MILGGLGLMLKPDPNTGDMVSRRPRPLDDTVPTEYDYSSYAPYYERAYPLRWLFGGAGQSIQLTGKSYRYLAAINVDTSCGYRMKGPFFHLVRPANTGPVTGFVEGIGSDGLLHLFALCGQYVNQLEVTDGWTLQKDFGAGASLGQAARFRDGGTTPHDALYFGWSQAGAAQHFWQWIGATNAWTQGPYPAAGFLNLREELWKNWQNFAAKCTSDPMAGTDGGTGVGGDWAGAIAFGDGSAQINWMGTTNNMLFVFSENKVFSVDTTPTPNLDKDLFPGLVFSRSKTNGVNTAPWAGALWVPFGNGFYRMTLGTFGREEIQLVGPERFGTNTSEVRGPVVASAGHATWFNYIAQYDAISGNSYLSKLGSWVPPELSGQADVVFTTAWHGAIKKWAGKQVTSMAISNYNSTNDRLWVGFEDGDVLWAKLPRSSPNPTNDPNCEFNTEDGWVDWPLHTAETPTEYKNWRGFTATGPTIDQDNRVWMEYHGDLVAESGGGDLDGQLYSNLDLLTYAQMEAQTGNYLLLEEEFTYSGQRLDLPTGVVGKTISVREHLANASTSSTPVVEAVAIHEQLRPEFVLEHDIVADANTPVAKRDGSVSPLSSDQIRDKLHAIAALPGTVQAIMPDGTAEDVAIVDFPGESLTAWMQSSGDQYSIPLKLVQFKSNAPLRGTYERLESGPTYGDYDVLTYADMEVF